MFTPHIRIATQGPRWCQHTDLDTSREIRFPIFRQLVTGYPGHGFLILYIRLGVVYPWFEVFEVIHHIHLWPTAYQYCYLPAVTVWNTFGRLNNPSPICLVEFSTHLSSSCVWPICLDMRAMSSVKSKSVTTTGHWRLLCLLAIRNPNSSSRPWIACFSA